MPFLYKGLVINQLNLTKVNIWFALKLAKEHFNYAISKGFFLIDWNKFIVPQIVSDFYSVNESFFDKIEYLVPWVRQAKAQIVLYKTWSRK